MQDGKWSPCSLLPGSEAAGTSSAREELEMVTSTTAYMNV